VPPGTPQATGGAHNDHNGETLLPVPFRKATTSHGSKDSELDWERWEGAEASNTLDAGSNDTANGITVDALERSTDRGVRIVQQLAVRRLTPLECLRLQGLPDDWLDDLGLADSVKYRMVGNSVAVPCVEWLARRMLRSMGH
jgi:site-specific DNA-cytosine methylase